MLLKIVDFLDSQKYIDLVYWAKQISAKSNLENNNPHQILIKLIENKELNKIVEFLKKKKYISVDNYTYSFLFQKFTQNFKEISLQWKFEENFNKEKPKINLVLKNDILVFQEIPSNMIENDFINLSEIIEITSNPSNIIVDGALYNAIALNSIDNIQYKLTQSKFYHEFKNFRKYEKIIKFIEELEDPLQKLFSINQIGVIFHNNELYLVKWVQYIREEQLIEGYTISQSPIKLLDEFGVIIGLKIKPNLELGDLVVFSERNNKKNENNLTPLLSIDESLFVFEKKEKKYDFLVEKDCNKFIDEILARIESGILLLTRKKENWVKNPEELDKYIQITLEKMGLLHSINQRLNILKDLNSINKNSSLKKKIKSKLEKNYLLFMKEQFIQGNTSSIPSILDTMKELQLYSVNFNNLLYTITYLFDTYYAKSEIILKTVNFLFTHWEISDEAMKLLEKPQLIALSNNVIDMLNMDQSDKIINYLTNYLSTHPYFKSFHLLSLMMKIMMEIYYLKKKGLKIRISNLEFITYLKKFINSIQIYTNILSDEDKNLTKSNIEANFIILSLDLDFITFLNDNMITYLTIIKTIDDRFLSKRIYFKIIRNISEKGPLIVFHKQLPIIGLQLFEFLTKIYNNYDLSLGFCVDYINLFNKSGLLFNYDEILFAKYSKIVIKIKNWIDLNEKEENTNFNPNFLLPLKKEIAIFLKDWYISGQLPEYNFDIHKILIITWVKFAELETEIDDMYIMLSIKDFTWSCEQYNLEKMQQKYIEIAPSVFEEKFELLINEFKKIIQLPFHNLNEFKTVCQIFRIIQKEYLYSRIIHEEFIELISLFGKNFKNSINFIIESGTNIEFGEIFDNCNENFLFLTIELFTYISEALISIPIINLDEVEHLNIRLNMLIKMNNSLGELENNYKSIMNREDFIIMNSFLLQKDKIIIFNGKFNLFFLQLFENFQKLLLFLIEKEQISTEALTKPLKQILISIIDYFKADPYKILIDLSSLSKEIYENPKILNHNKKIFFKSLLTVINTKISPKLRIELINYKQFVDRLSNLEALYFTIQKNDYEKILNVKNEAEEIIQINRNLFLPWFILGNCLAIRENNIGAIKAYKEALKYNSSQSNYSRLYHNLLVAYLSLNYQVEAIKLVKSLDIGIKTSPFIKNLIKNIEQHNNIQLLPVKE